MFNKNKNKIHLTEDEKLIIIRSLNKYSNELKNLRREKINHAIYHQIR